MLRPDTDSACLEDYCSLDVRQTILIGCSTGGGGARLSDTRKQTGRGDSLL